MDTPLDIRDVYNMSLQNNNNDYPHVVTQFSCNRRAVPNGLLVYHYESEMECAAVQLHNVHNITIKGISLTVQAPNMSGMTLKYSSNIHIQLNVSCLLMAPYPEIDIRIGILMYEASTVEVYSSHTNNCSSGLVFHTTNNIDITNTTAMYSSNTPETLFPIGGTGISLLFTTNAIFVDTTTMHNAGSGMFLEDSANVSILCTTVMHNGYVGIGLVNTGSITTMNTNVMYNGDNGMDLESTTRISIINTTAVHNGNSGIYLRKTTRINITDTTAMHNDFDGMYLWNTTSASIINTTVMYNGYNGMGLENSTTITIINTTAMHNVYYGLYLWNTTRSSITSTTAMYNDYAGMYLLTTTRIIIINTTVVYNGYIGMDLEDANRIYIFNTTAMRNSDSGLHLLNTTDISIRNITAMHNSYDGISLYNTARISIISISALCNEYNGIYLWNSTRIAIIDTTVMYNGYDGMDLENTTRISITNTTAVHNNYIGISLWSTTRVNITNMTAMHNYFAGIDVLNTTRISIIHTTVMYNGYNGMDLENTTSVSIINATVILNDHYGIYLWKTTLLSVINTTVMYNGYNGIGLKNTTKISVTNTTVLYNADYGMFFEEAAGTAVINTTTAHNGYFGMFLLYTNRTRMINVTAVHNGHGGIQLHFTINTNITKSSLMHNGWRREVTTLSGDFFSAADSTSLPAVVVLYYSSLHVSGCIVKRNNISAVKAYASNITASGDLSISDNRAIAGTAFILVQNSILKLAENSHMYFRNNHAINIGGVFYVTDNVYYDYAIFNQTLYTLLASTCFLETQGSRSQTKLTFSNNSAGEGGDILYGGHVLYGMDGEWNCLQSFRDISSMSQSGLSLITSDPSRVCLCNENGEPDCLIVADPAPHSIYPGQSINISAVVVGQVFGTVAGSVYAQFLQDMSTHGSPQLAIETWQKVQGVTQENCNHLEYTIFSSDDVSKVVLILTANNKKIPLFINEWRRETDEWSWMNLEYIYNTSALEPMKHSHDPVYVSLSLMPCPAGFMVTSDQPFRCDCNQLLQGVQGVKCYIQDQTIGRSGLVWVGTLKDDNGTVVASEYCLFDYCDTEDSNVTLGYPDSQCNYNHSGTLCGGCQPGLSLALGSVQCLPCSNKCLALLVPFALAGPALVFFIKLLDFTISQGTINGLVFYANIVKANEYILLPQKQTNPLTLFIAWLNLDLGVETCFFHGLTAYTKTWLQFVFPLYIWSIAGLIIISAKYSDRVAKVMGNNSVPVLATLFLLSYAKLFRTVITALSYTVLYSSQSQKAVWSADGNVDYLGSKHAPLFAVAVAALLFLYLPYTLLLFLGQWLHRFNCRLTDHILMKTKPFLDAHYGPLKGKHHYWFGALLLVRATILLISALTPTNHANVVNFCISVSAIVLMYFGPIVHSNIIVAMFDISFFMNLALLCVTKLFTTTSGGDQGAAAYTLVGVAFAQFLGLVLFKLFSILKRSEKVMACLHKRQPAEDDWELYEEAALQREMESDTEEEYSNGSTSIESLPTY